MLHVDSHPYATCNRFPATRGEAFGPGKINELNMLHIDSHPCATCNILPATRGEASEEARQIATDILGTLRAPDPRQRHVCPRVSSSLGPSSARPPPPTLSPSRATRGEASGPLTIDWGFGPLTIDWAGPAGAAGAGPACTRRSRRSSRRRRRRRRLPRVPASRRRHCGRRPPRDGGDRPLSSLLLLLLLLSLSQTGRSGGGVMGVWVGGWGGMTGAAAMGSRAGPAPPAYVGQPRGPGTRGFGPGQPRARGPGRPGLRCAGPRAALRGLRSDGRGEGGARRCARGPASGPARGPARGRICGRLSKDAGGVGCFGLGAALGGPPLRLRPWAETSAITTERMDGMTPVSVG